MSKREKQILLTYVKGMIQINKDLYFKLLELEKELSN